MNKRLLAFLFLCFTTIGLVSAADFSANGISYIYKEFKIGDQTELGLVVSSCGSSAPDIIIPEEILVGSMSYPVVGIAANAFQGKTTLQSISLPSNMKYWGIAANAFTGCSNLKKATFSSVEDLLMISFDNESSHPLFNGGDLYFSGEEIPAPTIIVDGVSQILPYTFFGCKSIKSLIIKDSVKTIGYHALNNTNLYSLTIGKNVNSITGNSIQPKKTIFLGNSTIPVGYSLVAGRINYVGNEEYKLTNQVVYNELSSMYEVDGIWYVPAGSRTCDVIDCSYYPNDYEINIPQTIHLYSTSTPFTVNDIKPYACYGNTFFHNGAKIGNNGNIGNYAFAECLNIGGTTIISNNGNIENYAFYNSGLSITDVHNAGYIGVSAFAKSSISILSVTNQGHIYSTAFEACTNITSASIENTGDIKNSAFKNSFRENEPSSVIVNNKSGIIELSAFENCGISELVIGRNAQTFGRSAFKNCDNLKTVLIPDNVLEMGGESFSGCDNLKSVTIGAGLRTISDYMFADCVTISEITFPQTLANIEYGAFNGCFGLSRVIFNDRKTVITIAASAPDIDGYIQYGIFKDSPLEYVYIGGPMSFTISPFAKQNKLSRVVIGDNADAIYDGEFAEDTKLSNLSIGQGVQYIGQRSFYNCRSLANVVLNSAVSEIRNEAFSGCSSIPEMKIPAATTLIGVSAFRGCTSLETFIINEGNNTITIQYTIDSNKFRYSKTDRQAQFVDCPLDSVYIGKKIQYESKNLASSSPFFWNETLRSVRITENEEEVYPNEFLECCGLKNVYLGGNVTTINEKAFSGCSSLDYIEIGENVQILKRESFSDDTQVSKVVCYAIIPPLCEQGAISDIHKTTPLYVPKKNIDQYKNIELYDDKLYENWGDHFLDIRTIVSESPALTINYKTLELRPFETETLKVVSSLNDNATYTWSSSNSSSVIINAATGEITASMPGKAIITCTSSNPDIAAVTCEVTVPEFIVPEIDTDGFYKITNAEDLYWLQHQTLFEQNTNIHAKLINNIIVNENVLTESGELNGNPRRIWMGIGGLNDAFTGIFDGQGYSISGIFSCDYLSASNKKGFIGAASGATIKNLCIKDSYFAKAISGYIYVGSICGYANNNTRIEGCINESTVANNRSNGGIIGYAINSTIINCQNKGRIGKSDSETCGGIAAMSNNSLISNCINYAPIAGQDEIAGICGYARGTTKIENCLNVGTLPITGTNIGAIVGTVYGTSVQVSSCYYDSKICNGSYADATLVAGLATSDFADGSIAFALNGECDDYDSNTLYWYQTIGSDVYPVLDITHNQVKDPSATPKTITIDDLLDEFNNDVEKYYDQITYTRNFKNTGWQELYVPFAMSYNDWKDDFEVGYIEGFLSRDLDNDGTIDETTWSGVKITEGTLLPNTPYIIRAKTTGKKAISLNNTTLYATESNSIDCSSTTMRYIFTGHYETVDFVNADDYPYYLNNGSFKFISSTFPFRWTLSFESRGTSFIIHPNITRGFVRENDGTPFEEYVENHQELFSGYKVFTIDGRMIDMTSETLSPGFYIKNNKKVLVK